MNLMFLLMFAAWGETTTILDAEGASPADTWELALERATGLGLSVDQIAIRQADGTVVPLASLRPSLPLGLQRPSKSAARSKPVTHPGPVDGALAGKAVYISQCHGWYWYDSLDRFSTQRGVLFSTVEDFHNPEGANAFLIPYLHNAGAQVFSARERDIWGVSAIVDDADDAYTESGTSFQPAGSGWGRQASYAWGDNPFEAGTARELRAGSGDVASWTLTSPATGAIALYLSWKSHPAAASDAHYRITTPHHVLHRWFDQGVHGDTWIFVDDLDLHEGDTVVVELVADGEDTGVLTADAVRLGGGSETISRHGDVMSTPRWQSGANLHAQFLGAPTSVYAAFGDPGNGSDSATRSLWADWEHPSGEDAVYLSWHSNAANGEARGTVTYFAGGGSDAPSSLPADCSTGAVSGSYGLAQAVQDHIVQAARAEWESTWQDRGVKTACFNEVNPSFNDEMPSVLVELAFHDNATDAAFLKNPAFRQDMARAMYKGIVDHFAGEAGTQPHYLPEPPTHLRVVHQDGDLVARWEPGPSGGMYGHEATGFVVQTSPDGVIWTDDHVTTQPATRLSARPGEEVYVRIVAENAGGRSFPSEVAGARLSPDGFAPVLVVGAFDRYEASILPSVHPPYISPVIQLDPRRTNTFDIVVPHGRAVSEAGWFFDAATDEAAEDLDLTDYAMVIWATGEESTRDETFSRAQQERIEAYLLSGGTLFTSGAEILWDLDFKGTDADRAFAADVLGATLGEDAAGTTVVEGVGLLEGIGRMDFDEADGAPYPVEYPDSLVSSRPAIAMYANGQTAGVLGEGVALMGMPFETIGDPRVRADVMLRLMEELVPDYVPPEVPDVVAPGDTGSTSGGSADARRPISSMGGCSTRPGAGLGWLLLGLLPVLGRRGRAAATAR